MTKNRQSVELLAPAGNREALEAAVRAGADAVYLGGKHFNMRLHRQDMNFDDEALGRAVEFAHAQSVRLYVTLNNLISEHELSDLKEFLRYLETIRPDAILVQDFAVVRLVRELGLSLPMHASVMMNIHNAPAIELLKEYGVVRVVASRELSLDRLALLRERTGMELEYFMHGDMCFAESGQCYHSGVLFGQSSNRGRCLKPCRWPYRLIDETTAAVLDEDIPGAYKLAIKDMCMYRTLPELIRSGVYSFKIEGRMRPADFIFRIVSIYRRAIDAYLADPSGYSVDETDWQSLYEGRARDFSTCSALGRVTAEDIGRDGSREPRFFSRAVPEAGLPEASEAVPQTWTDKTPPRLSVRVADLESARTACDNGADAVYIGGEVWRPNRPWTRDDIRRAANYAHERGALCVVGTPRTTMERECGELAELFAILEELGTDGVLVGNPGALRLARQHTSLPVQTDFGLNVFNHIALEFLKAQGVAMATASLELALDETRQLLENAPIPVEVIIHGAYESMIADHNIPAFSLPRDVFAEPERDDRRFALLDEAGERHPIRIDQYGRNHILFTKDLCLRPYLPSLGDAASFRIEAQDYAPDWVGTLTAYYRKVIDRLAEGKDAPPITLIAEKGPRALGIGAYRFRESK